MMLVVVVMKLMLMILMVLVWLVVRMAKTIEVAVENIIQRKRKRWMMTKKRLII